MLRNSDIKQLIAYLKTHPTAARELAQALEPIHNGDENLDAVVDRQTSNPNHASETPREAHVCGGTHQGKNLGNGGCTAWITAVEMGLRVGQSGRWVRERVQYLPPECVKRGSRQRWLIDERMTNNLMMMR